MSIKGNGWTLKITEYTMELSSIIFKTLFRKKRANKEQRLSLEPSGSFLFRVLAIRKNLI